MNKPVSFELAKLLKEKRFGDYSYQRVFTDSENPIEDIVFGSFEVCEANYKENKYLCKLDTIIEYPTKTKEVIEYYHPTIAEVVMWLYEKHGIWIHVHQEIKINGLELIGTGKFQGFINRINHTSIFDKKVEGDIPDGPYRKPVDSPTEAYEAAIEFVLKNLI